MTTDTVQMPKRGIPRWLIIVLVIAGLCLIGFCIVVVLTLLSPTLYARMLPAECVRQNPDMNQQACTDWYERAISTAAYDECFQLGMNTGDVGVDVLYVCLVERGVGPDQ